MVCDRVWDAPLSGLDSKKITPPVPEHHSRREFRRVFEELITANESADRARPGQPRKGVESPAAVQTQGDDSGFLEHMYARAESARLEHSAPSPVTASRVRFAPPPTPARASAPEMAHQVLVGTARGEQEARVRFSSGPLVGTEVQLRMEGDRVSIAVLTEGAVSRQTLGQVLSEFTRRFDGKTRRFADGKPNRASQTSDRSRER